MSRGDLAAAAVERLQPPRGIPALGGRQLVSRIQVEMSPTNMKALQATGHRQLSAYDAAYLLLAERIAAPLATRDGKLIAAAKAAGVDLAIDT